MPRKKKQVTKGRNLFRPIEPNAFDGSAVQDYGESNWEPNERFQAACRLPAGSDNGSTQGTASARPRQRRSPYCTLVLSVPAKLGYIAKEECKKLWPDAQPSFRSPTKLHVDVKREEIGHALEMRSVLGYRVLAADRPKFFDERFFTGENRESQMLGKVKFTAKEILWTAPLHAWALLTSNGKNYDADVLEHLWFPPPSFRVRCETPDGIEIVNYTHIVHAFTQGFQKVLSRWEVNPNSADIDIILELEERKCEDENEDGIVFEDMKVLIDLKPFNIVSPFSQPAYPLTDAAVAHTLLWKAKLQPGDVLVNLMCSAIDVAEEALQSFPDLGHIVTCDASPFAVVDSINQAGQYCETRGIDGAVCDMSQLPFTDSSVDVIIGMLHVPSEAGITSRILLDQLQELTRISRVGTGRVCFLTDHHDEIESLLQKRQNWREVQTVKTAFGSFECLLCLLSRSDHKFQKQEPQAAPDSHENIARSHGRRRTNAHGSLAAAPGPTGRLPRHSPTVFHPLSRHVYADDDNDNNMDWDDVV